MSLFQRIPLLAWTAISSLFLPATSGQFSYDLNAPNGPNHWDAVVTSDTNECSGSKQSPIALTTASSSCGQFADYIFTPGTCTFDQVEFELENNAVKANYKDTTCTKNKLKIPDLPDEEFELLQFHIHTTSEHTLDGLYYGGELHMVHQSTKGTGKLAVVGMFFQPGNHQDQMLFNSLLERWQEEFDKVEINCTAPESTSNETATAMQANENGSHRHLRALGEETTTSSPLNVYDFVANTSATTFLRYDGSLTTPPCSEKVYWSVADQPIPVSIAEFQKLVDIILNYVDEKTCHKATLASPTGSTGRPLQPLNGRTVTRICPVDYKNGNTKQQTTSAAINYSFGFSVTSTVVVMIAFLFSWGLIE